MWMGVVPVPGSFHKLLQVEVLGFPIELTLRATAVCHEFRGITRSTVTDNRWDLPASYEFACLNG